MQTNENRFEWDSNKNKINIKKHGISFGEAATVFLDDDALIINDDEHSEVEKRFIIVGMSKMPRLLVVCHCLRDNDKTIRIISARKANNKEAQLYGGSL